MFLIGIWRNVVENCVMSVARTSSYNGWRKLPTKSFHGPSTYLDIVARMIDEL